MIMMIIIIIIMMMMMMMIIIISSIQKVAENGKDFLKNPMMTKVMMMAKY